MEDGVYAALKTFKDDVAALCVVKGDLHANLYQACIRASLAKAYDFCEFAYHSMEDSHAMHSMGGLRSICEDLIVLKAMERMSPEDKSELIASTMSLTVDTRTRHQCKFISKYHFGQPVFDLVLSNEQAAHVEETIERIWKQYGFKPAIGGKPTTKELARSVGAEALEVLYDFMFDLTSGVVHFNVPSLFKMGWGPDPSDVTFSPTSLGPYYRAFCKIYGVFLLTIYFEFFEGLSARDGLDEKVRALRRALVMERRWPELVTFEEMNQKLPSLNVFAHFFWVVLSDEYEEGFVRGSQKRAEPGR